MWALRNLKRSGFGKDDLLGFYRSLLRPVIEFCAAVYASFLTQQQAAELERLQKHAVNVITGGYESYSGVCELLGLQKLSERRETIVEKFAVKSAQSVRFGDKWLPLKLQHGYHTRQENNFYQNKPRTESMKRGPLYQMTNCLNALAR